MQVFPGVLKNTLAQGLSRLGTVLVSVVLTGVLYRLLKDDGFGAYSFISALVLLFAHISDWGTNIITVKQASQEKEKQPEIFGSLIIFRFVLAVVSFLLVNVVVRANPSWQSLIHPTTIVAKTQANIMKFKFAEERKTNSKTKSRKTKEAKKSTTADSSRRKRV